MFENKNPFRPVMGVQPTRTASNDELPAGKVVHCIPLEMFAVQYGDETGRGHKTVFVRMGETWYAAPNSETWAQSLKEVSPNFNKQLEQMLAFQRDKSVPKTDTVDVTD